MAPRSVLITGCSAGGIGDALAQSFNCYGLRVFATARDLSKVGHLKKMGIETIELDVVDPVSVEKAVKSLQAATGGTLDILVHNAGGGNSMPLLDVDVDIAKDLFDLNVFSIIRVTQAFAPFLIAAKGTVVTIGSTSGVGPMPWNGVYSASKAAAHLLNDNLRLELAPLGVKVLLVVAGGVMTNFAKNIPAIPLPKNSPYAQVKDMVPPRLAGRKFDVRTILKPHQFAESVVREAVKAQPRARLWTGTWAELAWAVKAFGRATVWDRIMSKIFDLRELKEKLQATKKKAHETG